MTTPLCFIDTETTSLRPDRRAWEIAMIRRDPVADRRSLLLQITDVDLSDADPMALKVGGFYDRAPGYRPAAHLCDHATTMQARTCTESQAATFVEQWTRGAVLVGVGVAFDSETLDPMLRRHGLAPAWHYGLVDLKAMAAGWLLRDRPHHVRDGSGRPLDWPEGFDMVAGPPWSSDAMAAACGVEPPSDEDRHTAMGDARWAMRWYDAMTGGAR